METINILGVIGTEVFAEDIIKQIQEVKSKHIRVIIASSGGSAYQGLMISDALLNSGKEVTTVALGLGASAAFLIFLSGNNREMGDTTLLMAHNSRAHLSGTAQEINEQLEALNAIDERMKDILMKVSGISDKKATEILSKDTYMNIHQALELNIATGSIKDNIAAYLNLSKNKKKEPIKMADELKADEVSEENKGLLRSFLSWLKSNPTAEKDPEKEEMEAEEDPEKEEVEAEEDPEKEEMKEKIKALEKEIESLKSEAKALQDESAEEIKKSHLIFNAVSEHKFTMHEAKKLSLKTVKEVEEACANTAFNASGAGKTERPDDSKIQNENKYDIWMSLRSKGEHQKAQLFYNENRDDIKKDK